MPQERFFGENLLYVTYEDKNYQDSQLRVARHKIFTDKTDKNDIKDFVEQQVSIWVDNFCEETLKIKEYELVQYDKEPVYTGNYYPYRAVYQGWDEEKKQFIVKASWYIYQSKP